MKEIKAVIGPSRLVPLHDALRAVPGFPGMSVSRAQSYTAPARRPAAEPRGRGDIRLALTDHVERWRIEMVVPDEHATALYEAVVASVTVGPPGDSVVWMSDVERASFIHRSP